MSRKKGLLNISANFEPQIASPFDSRTVVDTFSDLTNPSTFVSTDSNSYVYKGLVVSVVNDPGAGNGVYLLKGLPSTDENNWEKLGSSMPIDTPEYDAGATYNVGDVIVYISPQAEFLPEGDPFKEEYLYKCIIEANAGESPETLPEKWERLGKLSDVSNSIILIENVLGLQDSLNERVKYTDIGSNLSVTSEKKVNVDISYVTVNNYSPAEDIVATPGEEVTINGVIWKTKNETWNDGGEGIIYSRENAYFSSDIDTADPDIYGMLYNIEGLFRLLQNSPGYRLPVPQDFINSWNQYESEISDPRYIKWDATDLCLTSNYWRNRSGQYAEPEIGSTLEVSWENYKQTITNYSGLSLINSGGGALPFIYPVGGYGGHFRYWVQKEAFSNYTFTHSFYNESKSLYTLHLLPGNFYLDREDLFLQRYYYPVRLVKDI